MTTGISSSDDITIKKAVREHYSNAIKVQPEKRGCNSTSCCGESSAETAAKTQQLYEDPAFSDLPEDVTEIAFGCGDPVTLASLAPGQTVLDLGSGGGIDCFLAGKKVGETGHVIGVDMTPDMIDRARANLVKIGAKNVEFRLGEIEHLPVEDATVDVVISNCVINLSTDKPQVFREMFRVLKPGGRMAVSDIVTDGEIPEEIRDSMTSWAECVAGAWDAKDYIASIHAAGFSNVKVLPVYMNEELISDTLKESSDPNAANWNAEDLQKKFFSAKITAEKN